jgi:hypothetical protein
MVANELEAWYVERPVEREVLKALNGPMARLEVELRESERVPVRVRRQEAVRVASNALEGVGMKGRKLSVEVPDGMLCGIFTDAHDVWNGFSSAHMVIQER